MKITVHFHNVTCAVCYMPFFIEGEFQKSLHEKGGNFYCPAGHEQHYTAFETLKLRDTNEKLQRQTELDAYTIRSLDRQLRKANRRKK